MQNGSMSPRQLYNTARSSSVRVCVVRRFPRIFGEVNLYTAIPFTRVSTDIDSLRSSTQRISFTKLSIVIDSLTPRTQRSRGWCQYHKTGLRGGVSTTRKVRGGVSTTRQDHEVVPVPLKT